MARYSKESLLQLKNKVDLIEVLSRHVEMKRTGAVYKTLCPFHEEKTPSFMIKRGDTHYHCFGCGAHGDAIQFLMTYLHLSFAESVEMLADQFHVRLEKVEEKETGIDWEKLKEALSRASEFFHFCLLQTKEGIEALEYLYARDLTMDFIQRFGVGYAPLDGQLFRQVMQKKGFNDSILQQAGLLTTDGRVFFRDRITFPIHSASGAIVSFSSRKYKEETFGGKYINGPETPLFKKSRTLFGLNYSRRIIAKERRALIVEGQIDCLRLIAAGFDGAVAALGTAFTEEHVQELKNLGILTASLLFDGDSSGQAAASKVGHLFQKKGIDVQVFTLPSGYDPDRILREFGVEGMRKEMGKGSDYLSFQVKFLSKDNPKQLPASKTAMVREIAQQIREWEEPLFVYESLKKLAELTGVPRELLLQGEAPPPPKKREGPPPLEVNPDKILEYDLLRLLLLFPEKVGAIAIANVQKEDFRLPFCQRVFQAALQLIQEKRAIDLLGLLSLMQGDETEAEGLEEIFSKKVKGEKSVELFTAATQRLLERQWMEKREQIQRELMAISAEGERGEALMREFDLLTRARPIVKNPLHIPS